MGRGLIAGLLSGEMALADAADSEVYRPANVIYNNLCQKSIG